MKKWIVPGILFTLTGLVSLASVFAMLLLNRPSEEEQLLRKYESAIKAGNLDRVLALNGIKKQGILNRYKEEDIPYLGKKPEFIYGNRISGNEGEKGVIEYAVIYQEDEELKYEIRRDQVIKTEGQMYILNW